MIEIRNVVKTFDGFAALNGVNMNVEKGSIYGLVGPNGAGKTTLMNTFCGILMADGGTLTVDGESMIDEGILTGDMIIVTRSFDVRDGDIIVARINGESATVKRMYREGDVVRLQPSNANMAPIMVKPEDMEIVGKVIGLFRSY